MPQPGFVPRSVKLTLVKLSALCARCGAFRLAVSGKFADAAAVESELRSRGYAHVDNIALSKFAHEQITAMCQNARRAKENRTAERTLTEPVRNTKSSPANAPGFHELRNDRGAR
jgi:hypothetical protein